MLISYEITCVSIPTYTTTIPRRHRQTDGRLAVAIYWCALGSTAR